MSGIEILLSDHHGVYLPLTFVRNFDGLDNIKRDDIDTVKLGPSEDWYWDAWTNILDSASFEDKSGNVWRLYQDGDLFSYCPELMTDEEYEDFFGEARATEVE